MLGNTEKDAPTRLGPQNSKSLEPRQRLSQFSRLGSITGFGSQTKAIPSAKRNTCRNHTDDSGNSNSPAADAITGSEQFSGVALSTCASRRRFFRNQKSADARPSVNSNRTTRLVWGTRSNNASKKQNVRFPRQSLDRKSVLRKLGR